MIEKQTIESATIKSVRQVLLDNYELDAELSRLPGENLNYLACVNGAPKFVVKVAAEDQTEAFVAMEFLALKHAASALSHLQLPQIQESKFGNAETYFNTGDNDPKRLRVIDYLSGILLENTDISANLRRNLGISLAEFDRAVADFDHSAAHREHPWDLTRALQHRDNIRWLTKPEEVELLSWAYEQYANIDTGNINHINWQFIHGDANPENILVNGDEVIGLLDFGDSCYNPRICELAICLPYLMMDQDDPIAVAKQLIAGYESVSPLNEPEFEILWPLILGRLATTISMATARRQLDPNHPNWFVSEGKAWRLLKQLHNIPGLGL